ncbi:hypothetical protein D6764_01140 [Candidatus Woesearchaeota archaeon]|nr:MAG: hypothetical protein D6764_01140 [Candidatus Woesearchaeota archaeon]
MSDSRNIVTLAAGVFSVVVGVKYYLSPYAHELPTFLKYGLATVVGAGIAVYWLMLMKPAREPKVKSRAE